MLAWLVIAAVILLAATTVALNADHMPDNDQKPRERDQDESRQEATDVRLAA